MVLSDIRKLFIKHSGRYDLVTEEGEDNGADFFIQSGCRFLDRRSNIKCAQASLAVRNVYGDGRLQLMDCWLIDEILASSTGDNWYPLQKLHDSRSLLGATAYGAPRYYIQKITPYVPPLGKRPTASIEGPASSYDHPDMTSNSILLEILPHPSKTYSLEIRGSFYTPPLLQNQDSNFWSESLPDTLVKASLYELEIFYRNTEGANDWLSSIQLDLTDAEQMEVLADIHKKDIMGL